MKLFLDTNVIFAAAISPQGRSHALFALARAGYGTLLTSGFAVEEARRNIGFKYPQASERLEELIGQCRLVPEGAAARVVWAQDHLPAKDAPILAAAIEAKAEGLITGDRAHFGALYGQTLEGTEILSLAEGLERLLAL